MDLAEDNRKITPRDYLELALRPTQGGGKDMHAKNEVPHEKASYVKLQFDSLAMLMHVYPSFL